MASYRRQKSRGKFALVVRAKQTLSNAQLQLLLPCLSPHPTPPPLPTLPHATPPTMLKTSTCKFPSLRFNMVLGGGGGGGS